MVFSATAALEFHLGIFNRYPPSLWRGNEVADALSGINFQEMAEDQARENEVTTLKTAVTRLQLRENNTLLG